MQRPAIRRCRAGTRIGRRVLPHDLARRRQRRGAVGAEMHVDAVAVDDRRRRRAAVLRIEVDGSIGAKHLDVHELAPGRRRRRPARAANRRRLGRRRQPDAPARDRRERTTRRPAPASSRRRCGTRSSRAAGHARSNVPGRSGRGTAASPRPRPGSTRSGSRRRPATSSTPERSKYPPGARLRRPMWSHETHYRLNGSTSAAGAPAVI